MLAHLRGTRGSVRAGVVGLVAIAAVLAVITGGFSLATPTSAHIRSHQSAGGITFSHAVVVDQQRPGFEPDVKADGNNVIYSSIPFGFSTTQSFIWASHDNGNSYQLTPGNIGPGKPTTCVGGGDTDLYVDAKNALYFSDLQGLTNISNSMSTDGGTTWNTNCAGAPNTPDDRMWLPAPAARRTRTSSSTRTTTRPSPR